MSKIVINFSLNFRWRKNLGWSGEHLRGNVEHDGAQADRQGQPLLLQVQRGGGQVERVRNVQVSWMNIEWSSNFKYQRI